MDLAQSRRGVDMGPSAIRAARLQERLAELGHEVEDAGNVAVEIAETRSMGDRHTRYLEEITGAAAALSRKIAELAAGGRVPVVLGGDHSIAAGTMAGMTQAAAARGERIGLIWLDAHADMNTPQTSPSGNIHGMALGCCLGQPPAALADLLAAREQALRPSNVALAGVRSVDPLEKDLVRRSGIHAFTMRAIDERGMRAVVEEAICVASEGTAGFHVSLDLDVVDPREAPGVGTPCPGGVSYREAHLAMEIISDSGLMRSFEVVEVNPILDERNRTAELAVDLTASAFGKRIL